LYFNASTDESGLSGFRIIFIAWDTVRLHQVERIIGRFLGDVIPMIHEVGAAFSFAFGLALRMRVSVKVMTVFPVPTAGG